MKVTRKGMHIRSELHHLILYAVEQRPRFLGG